jgi:DNA polymerase III subunit gamma/tau
MTHTQYRHRNHFCTPPHRSAQSAALPRVRASSIARSAAALGSRAAGAAAPPAPPSGAALAAAPAAQSARGASQVPGTAPHPRVSCWKSEATSALSSSGERAAAAEAGAGAAAGAAAGCDASARAAAAVEAAPPPAAAAATGETSPPPATPRAARNAGASEKCDTRGDGAAPRSALGISWRRMPALAPKPTRAASAVIASVQLPPAAGGAGTSGSAQSGAPPSTPSTPSSRPPAAGRTAQNPLETAMHASNPRPRKKRAS